MTGKHTHTHTEAPPQKETNKHTGTEGRKREKRKPQATLSISGKKVCVEAPQSSSVCAK